MFQRAQYLAGITLLSWLVLIASPLIHGELIQEMTDSGCVDWERLTIKCTGVGEPSTEPSSTPRHHRVIKSSRADAIKKLLRTISGISVTSEITVEQIMNSDDAIQERVKELIQKFREVGVHYMSDGSVEIDVELSFRGALLELLLPPSGGGKRISDGLLCPLCGQPWPEGKEVPRDLKLLTPQGDPVEPFSGLVIDARGLGLTPALAPKVVNEAGKTVYSIGFAKRLRSLARGIVGYEQDLERAANRDRVAPNALVVKGLSAQGTNRTDVVIANEYTAMLHSMPEHLLFMEQARVIIVID